MARYTSWTASAQTADAQPLDATHAADIARTVADRPGTFASEQANGGATRRSARKSG